MKNNHLSKHAHKYNKASTHVDKKKLDKLEQSYNNVDEALQEMSDIDEECDPYVDIYGTKCKCCNKGYIVLYDEGGYGCDHCYSEYQENGWLVQDLYSLQKDCPVCEEGKLKKMYDFCQQNYVASYYYLCDNCGSEVVDNELSKINKQLWENNL